VLLLLATAVGVCQARPEQSLFAEGVTAYEQGEFQAAIAAWEQRVRAGRADAATYYNLGNAYFKAGWLGRAVLNWERARRLDPRDRDTLENLDFARRLLVDEVPRSDGTLARWLERLGGAVSFEETALGGLALWTLLGLAGLAAILAGGLKRRAALAAGGVLLTMLLALSPILGWHLWRLGESGDAVVLVVSVDVRSGPGERYTSVFTVHEGLMLRVRQSASGWYRVSLPDGLGGWLPADAVERL
jgi:tetratricopeptide (TPR) repeat protein